jgi:hypothetical protein
MIVIEIGPNVLLLLYALGALAVSAVAISFWARKRA